MKHLKTQIGRSFLPAALLLCSQLSFGQQRIVDYEAICISPADTVVNGVGELLRFQGLNHGPDVGYHKDTILYWLYVIEDDLLHWSYSGAMIGTSDGIIDVGGSVFYRDNYAIRFPFPDRKDTFTVDFCIVLGSTFINQERDTVSPYTWIDPNRDNNMCCTPVTIVPKPSETSVQPTGVDAALTLYPNPADQVLYVRTSAEFAARGLSIMVRDLSGRLLLQQQYAGTKGKDSWSIEVGSLPAGIYQLQLQSPEGVVSRKVVIAR